MKRPHHRKIIQESRTAMLTLLGQEIIDADFKATPRTNDICEAIKKLDYLLEVYFTETP